MWGQFKSRFGWQPFSFLIEWEGYGSSSLLALCRRLAPAVSFAYIPWGPELPANFPSENRNIALAELADKIKALLPRNIAFVRFDPPWFEVEGKEDNHNEPSVRVSRNKNQKFIRAAADIQPPDTVIIDLELSCEEILGRMKPKWRYNISLSEKRGVLVRMCNERDAAEGLETFYALLKETAARDGIAIHSIDYYKTLFEISAGKNDLRLYTAVHEIDTLAAIVVLFRGECATYLYGASSGVKRNLMAPYALQWKAMQDAKEAGCKYYDLFGIPPDDDPDHPMAGLYRFKTGFGGEIVHRPGSWDYPYKRIVYSLFRKAEALRKKIRDGKKRK
jgi:lipid II:glycine glycyltransferase (peptidoglycan interpeptide bridge formation enzyme)